MLTIRYAREKDSKMLKELDQHISEEVLEKKILGDEYLVLLEDHCIIGYLRYSMFWDEHPFMNLLYIVDAFRCKGYGSKLTLYWENEMKNKDFDLVMTSSQSNEYSQHFYRKLGYKDIGSFTFPGEYLELMLVKEIK